MKIHITISIDKELHRAALSYCERNDISLSALVRKLVREKLIACKG